MYKAIFIRFEKHLEFKKISKDFCSIEDMLKLRQKQEVQIIGYSEYGG